MIYMKQTSAIELFAVLNKCGFHHYHCQSQSGARAIIKFAGDVQIAEIIRCQFYL